MKNTKNGKLIAVVGGVTLASLTVAGLIKGVKTLKEKSKNEFQSSMPELSSEDAYNLLEKEPVKESDFSELIEQMTEEVIDLINLGIPLNLNEPLMDIVLMNAAKEYGYSSPNISDNENVEKSKYIKNLDVLKAIQSMLTQLEEFNMINGTPNVEIYEACLSNRFHQGETLLSLFGKLIEEELMDEDIMERNLKMFQILKNYYYQKDPLTHENTDEIYSNDLQLFFRDVLLRDYIQDEDLPTFTHVENYNK